MHRVIFPGRDGREKDHAVIVGDQKRFGRVGAWKPFEIQLDDSHAYDLSVEPNRLRKKIAGLVRDGADAEETAHLALDRVHDIGPEAKLRAHETIGVAPVAGRDAIAVGIGDVGSGGVRVAVDVIKIAVDLVYPRRRRIREHVLHERIDADDVGQGFVAFEHALEGGRGAIAAHRGIAAQRIDTASPGQSPGQDANRDEPGGQSVENG